jgi:predicted enzyme related to lactoylglutathione lyase
MSKFEANAITWFEIPTTDFDRATKFYEQMLDVTLQPFPGEQRCSMFPVGQGGVAGCITQRPQSKPSAEGTTVFLNANGKMDASIKRAEKLGAKITVPRTEIPGGYGYFACLIDSEGNHIGLHTLQF